MISQVRLYPVAFVLLALTLLYNASEGVIAIVSGIHADSIVLLSFGADSFIEVAAATAVLWRLSYRDEEAGERAEAKAFRFIGVTFLVLAAMVVVQSAVAISTGEGASESVTGLVLLCASLALMPILALAKLRTAAKQDLPALAAEAKETLACSYLSLTALVGLAGTTLLGAWWIDAVAALCMVPWLFKEGLEGVRAESCFDGVKICWCRGCWYGVRSCTDMR